MSNNIRIRTTPNGTDQYVKVKVEQDFDFIEILSLNISQDKAYETFCSDYGVIVGRVIINSGFGVPNAKVSVFIPIDDTDKTNLQISGLYPYQTVNDKNDDGIRYNLLPKESDSQDDCYTPVGTFPAKREVLDNDDMLGVFCKYYKYTTTTNYAGDFMIFGVPLGNYVVHVDADISNIGIASQRPYDLIDQGTPQKFFYSPTKFKEGRNLNSLVQIKSANAAVNVQPFWGDVTNCEIGINRLDIDLNYTIRPSAIFMGSVFGDSAKNSVNKNCRPRKKLGQLCEQETSEGTIEMIRKTIDNQIEEFDVDGGRVIDANGAWAYQIPMNLDYVVTDEFGNLIPSEDPNKGIPTRTRARFRVSMDEGGGTGRLRTRAKYLVPHNPAALSDLDFNFDKTTKDANFVDLYWNKVYSVKSFISKTERAGVSRRAKTYVGIKAVDDCVGDKVPFPFNRTYTKNNILFTIICFILTLIATIVALINTFLCWLRGIKIVGWHPFKSVRPIKIICPSDPDTYWTPGCNGQTVTDYVDCISAVLADQLDLFQLDFYNDWVNGTLYYYLLKYKKKRRGREKFCETYCNDFQGGTGSNSCKTNQLGDTTVNSISDNFTHQFRNGLMVKYNGNLYYPPILLDGSNMKLFPTDIVNLGAVLSCDWQGFPKIVNYLTPTSYKIPPLIQEIDEEDNSIVTGMIQIGNLYVGLFYDINCVGVTFNARQATNIRRQCELNVDIPEVETGAPHATVTINEIYDTSDAIDSATSINRYIRDSFYLLNVDGPEIAAFPPFDPTPLNTPSLGTSFEYDGNINNPTHNDGNAYNSFRNFKFPQGGFPDMGFQSWGNSYYMYFGIIPGKTAYDKLMSKYFTSCIKAVSDDFIIDTTVTNTSTNGSSDGAIAFTFVGGTAPFTYTWTAINYSFGPATATTSGVITGLSAGTYTITAVDSLSTLVVKEVVVNGPQALACGFSLFQTPTTQISNDGSVNITQLIGGTPPYTLTVTGPSSTVTYTNVSLTNSPLTNIGVGTYTFAVTDSSSPLETCSQNLDITTVPLLTLSVDTQDVSCNTTCDGSINPTLSGGQTPYTISVTGPSYSQSGPYIGTDFLNLCVGTYNIIGTDAVGQTVNASVVLTQATPPSINTIGFDNTQQCVTGQTTIRFNIVQGSTPPPYTITYDIDGVINTQTANSNGQNNLVINQTVFTSISVFITDSDGCQSSTISYPKISIQTPTQPLILGGNRVGNLITYAATGGLTPYTYSPVDTLGGNTYTAPNANPVFGTVTDAGGCTESNIF